MPYPGEHAARMADPGQFTSFARQNDKMGDGIHVIFGIKGGKSEIQAIRFDKEKFSPEEAREWLKKKGMKPLSFEPASGGESGEEKEKQHKDVSDVIIQTLDRKIGEHYLDKESFIPTAGDWAKVPLIFAKEHPDHNLVLTDLDAALKAVKGRIAGEVLEPRVEVTGHPRLMGKYAIHDEEALRLKAQGKLSHSTGFAVVLKDGKTKGPVEPNHIILFEETDRDLPKDKGTFILNKGIKTADGETVTTLEKVKTLLTDAGGAIGNVLDSFSAVACCASHQCDPAMVIHTGTTTGTATGGYYPPAPAGPVSDDPAKTPVKNPAQEDNPMTDEIEKKLEVVNKELDTAKVELSKRDAQIKELEATILKFKSEQKDREWQAMKANLPPGMVHKPDDEAALRKEFEEQPVAFAMKVIQHKPADLPKAEGSAVTASPDEYSTMNADWKAKGGT